MTMPSLIQNYREKELVTSYKRVYSILNQAYLKLINEYGPYTDWDRTDEDTYNKFKTQLKLSADCPPGEANTACITDTTYKDLNNEDINPGILNTSRKQPAVRLISGESILFYNYSNGIHFIVDLNGNRNPNRLGEDLHFFSFNDGKNYMTILPGPAWSDSGNNNHGGELCQKEPSWNWFAGSTCGYWILSHGNMEYLHLIDKEILDKW